VVQRSPTQANLGALTLAIAQTLSEEALSALQPGELAQLPAACIPHLRAAAFGQLHPACIAAITAGQAARITQAQFAQFPAARIPDLSANAFHSLNPTSCIAHITQAQAQRLTAAQVMVMTPPQFAALPHARRLALTPDAFARLAWNFTGQRPLAMCVRDYLFANGWGSLVETFEGNRPYYNRNKKLPDQSYWEYDIYPKNHGNRGMYRIVIGGNEACYYTNKHYDRFEKLT